MPLRLLFYIWCVLEDGFVDYFIFDFLLCVTQKDGRRYLPVWLIGDSLITLAVTLLQLPGVFLMDVLVLFVFAKAVLKGRAD